MRARKVARSVAILHVHVERVVDLGRLPLAECGCPNRFRLAKQNQSLIDKVRAEVPKNAGGGIVRHLTPCAGLGIESKAVESGFVLGDRSQCARFQKLFDGVELSIPTTILVDGDQTAAVGRESNQVFGFRHRWSEWFVDDYVAPGFEAGFGIREVRIVRRGHHDQTDRLVGQHLVEIARNANFGILLFCIRGVPLENARKFHALDAANHGCVKCLPGQTKSDQSDSYHVYSLSCMDYS